MTYPDHPYSVDLAAPEGNRTPRKPQGSRPRRPHRAGRRCEWPRVRHEGRGRGKHGRPFERFLPHKRRRGDREPRMPVRETGNDDEKPEDEHASRVTKRLTKIRNEKRIN